MSQPRRELVTLAREARELTQEDLAERVGVKQATISKIENGQLAPTDDVMQRLAEALDFPVEFFSQDMQPNDLPASFFRRRLTGVTQKEVKSIRAHWAIVLRGLRTLLAAVEFPEASIPIFDLRRQGINPAVAAQRLRVQWNVPLGPIDNLTLLLESHGILVMPFDFGTQRVDGMSVYDRRLDLPPVLCFNSRLPGDRQRFTLAHELAHVVLHAHTHGADEGCDLEDEADTFASEFLLPSEAVRGHLSPVSLTSLASLKMYWKASIGSLLMKACELDLVTERQRNILWAQYSKRGWRTLEPAPIPCEEPTLIRQIIQLHESDLGYSEDDLARALLISKNDLRARYPVAKPTGLRLIRG